MDILVRVPKSEVDHFWEEVPETNISWWTLSQKPKHCGAGDYIYFLIDGEVQARAEIYSIHEGDLQCESTGRDWSGINVCWVAKDLERLDPPLEGSVTRGFKYYEPDADDA